jgi:preprotein translocase subunit SecG
MLIVLIVIHLLLTLVMVGLILLQRSEGGALGIGGGGVMSGRAAGNLLTRATAVVAAGFFVTSLSLALMSSQRSKQGSIMDAPIESPATPMSPAMPAVPLSH